MRAAAPPWLLAFAPLIRSCSHMLSVCSCAPSRAADLSERLWILRDPRDDGKVAVFTRSETRSVMDRRGLVADGQLKPSDDEATRYGKLLFGETIQDYSGWDSKQEALKAQKDKLLAK